MNMYVVKFDQRWGLYNAGEVAGFQEGAAKRLIQLGVAHQITEDQHKAEEAKVAVSEEKAKPKKVYAKSTRVARAQVEK